MTRFPRDQIHSLLIFMDDDFEINRTIQVTIYYDYYDFVKMLFVQFFFLTNTLQDRPALAWTKLSLAPFFLSGGRPSSMNKNNQYEIYLTTTKNLIIITNQRY